ncbi:hypothetical protein [Mesorhizobium sp. f-mel]
MVIVPNTGRQFGAAGRSDFGSLNRASFSEHAVEAQEIGVILLNAHESRQTAL